MVADVDEVNCGSLAGKATHAHWEKSVSLREHTGPRRKNSGGL